MGMVVMIGMVLTSGAVTILGIARRGEGGSTGASFTLGYLFVWAGFSAVATMVQWAFDSAHVLSEMMAIRSVVAAGLIIVAVGIYQLSETKRSCLRRCCSSKSLIADDQSLRASAAIPAGLTYGISSLGCCWALIFLL